MKSMIRKTALVLAGAALGLTGLTPLPTAATEPAQLLAATPPMGWNSWNTFGCDIDERLIRRAADALVNSGMRDAGYDHVVVDDCWFDPERGPDGALRSAPDRFPSGMKALADYRHARGLKFGLYQVPTEKTCAQRSGTYPGATGSRGHEQQDAATFAAWGVDYLKYDWCSPEGDLDDQVRAFTAMRDALRATGRPIAYSINPNSYHPAKTGATHDWSRIAHLWRTTEDIKPVWGSGNENAFPMGVVNIIDLTSSPRLKPGDSNLPVALCGGLLAGSCFSDLCPGAGSYLVSTGV